VIARQQADGSYATVRSIPLRPAGDGSFARSIGFLEAGQYQVIAHTDADAKNAVGSSAPITMTIA
jgi:hypothetical protein